MTLLWHGELREGIQDSGARIQGVRSGRELSSPDTIHQTTGPGRATAGLGDAQLSTLNPQLSASPALPIGICIFVSPPLSLRPRNQFFGRSGRWDRVALAALNRQLVLLQRVVLHPTYRGAGIAADFIRRSCELCPFPWVETLTQLGHVHPVFEQAGFIRVGVTGGGPRSRRAHSAVWGGRGAAAGDRLVSQETHEKSRWANPVYYVLDNRGRQDRGR